MSKQQKLNRDQKPETEQRLWLDSAAEGGTLGQTTLCPEGLNAKTSRWEEESIPTQVPWETDSETENWKREILGGIFLKIRTWKG